MRSVCWRVWRSFMCLAAIVAATALLAAVLPLAPCRKAFAAEPARLRAVDVGPTVRQLVEADWIDQDQRFGKPAAATPPSKPVTTAEDAVGGCDGVKTGSYGFHTASAEQDPWWQVDLGQIHKLDRVVVFNRTDANTAPRTRNLQILVSDGPGKPFRRVYQHDGQTFFGVKENKPLVVSFRGKEVAGRIVRLAVPGTCSFALDEVEVYPAEAPETNIALGRPADQKSVGRYSVAKKAATGGPTAGPATAEGPFSLAHIEAVLARAERLAKRLRSLADPQRLDPLVQELRPLRGRLAAMKSVGQPPVAARRELYLDARSLLRRIAFANPRLQIEKLLFLKRHDSAGVYHMCDQYYGCNAVPGGGLFVLVDPFTEHPKLIDLLENSVVEKGRLAGQKLQGGAFLSPEVSFDGRTILFAYTQAKAYAKTRGKEAYLWGPEISHHIFRVNADGTHLVQLTDGEWDDFDPCYLPNGRVVFVSLRRGGYLRCGRHCPVYTLFSMKDDGTDIICLSFHETHEWHPSVTNDGMIVYTRWDYVDRDTNIAHHIWTCFPDGRDPRSFHGNYPVRRESRPWMEMAIRAIPGSHKFVASTGAHHGHEFGSLVLIDPRIPDDGAMSQLERLTPEVPFPEAEGRPIAPYACYGTPWPLSEDDYLCVYDAAARNRGIYWIDRDGNKELIYRDPTISCVSPMPLAPRARPPVLPEQTVQTAEAVARHGGEVPPATIAVMNVYDSDFPWPQDARVAALRVIQVLPKTTPPPNQPRIGVAEQTNARAVLGTVPVEADGSAFFEAPVGREIYFQALDSRGLAIQSMRSGTYVHPGERLVCQGCHERKHRPPAVPRVLPLAMRRAPSKITPDVEGSNPFSFVRLVQPALDRNCVQCHQQKKALDLCGVAEGPHGWTRSYTNLAGKYGFYFHVTNGSINTGVHGGSRTVPGQFGARAAPLLRYLGPEHYGLKLSDEDFHRFTLWLDCNSEFFGAYENTREQAAGKVVYPSLN